MESLIAVTEAVSSQTVRVRFAPSPTGYLHIGGARTALFNFLFARHHERLAPGNKAVFVLRVEDTDRVRSTPEAVQAILEGLRYLGLNWDEGPEAGGDAGPYFQSERQSTYDPYVEQLLAAETVYPCFCSKERLDELREQKRQNKERFHYDRRCLELDPAAARTRMAEEPHVLRFKVPAGETVVEDLIRGRVVTRNAEIEDFIVRRSDGSVVYNFAVVGDDHDMGITHVIRGDDHLSNTPKQILLFQALGFQVPVYAHIPLILGAGGAKLSKRHGAVSVTEYRDQGYLPEAMNNFLARLGWSFDDKEEIFSMEDLIEKFSLGGVSKSGAVYDLDKLNHLGGHYMRERSDEDIFKLALPYLIRAGVVDEQKASEDRARLAAMISLEKSRIDCLSQIAYKLQYYFEDEVSLESGGRKVLRKNKNAAPLVSRYAEALGRDVGEEAWKLGAYEALEEHARSFAAAEDVKLGELAQPVRAILTGRNATPGLFEVVSLLGREKCLRRLGRAEELFAQAET